MDSSALATLLMHHGCLVCLGYLNVLQISSGPKYGVREQLLKNLNSFTLPMPLPDSPDQIASLP